MHFSLAEHYWSNDSVASERENFWSFSVFLRQELGHTCRLPRLHNRTYWGPLPAPQDWRPWCHVIKQLVGGCVTRDVANPSTCLCPMPISYIISLCVCHADFAQKLSLILMKLAPSTDDRLKGNASPCQCDAALTGVNSPTTQHVLQRSQKPTATRTLCSPRLPLLQ